MKKKAMAALTLVIVLLWAVSSQAGDILAYKRTLPTVTISSGTCRWAELGSIQMKAPSDGYVLITASGMAYFNSLRAPSLMLSLATASKSKGPWKFTLSPGATPYQTYNVEMVFSISAGTRTFYLNGASCDGDGRGIGVQTGSLTAEFYPADSVQAQALGAASTQAAPPLEGEKEPSEVNEVDINK